MSSSHNKSLFCSSVIVRQWLECGRTRQRKGRLVKSKASGVDSLGWISWTARTAAVKTNNKIDALHRTLQPNDILCFWSGVLTGVCKMWLNHWARYCEIKMLKYLWNRGVNPGSEREKLQKELFSFSKNVQYGFPHKPVSMDWDPHLKLLAIATKTGFIRIFGQPGSSDLWI